MEVNVVVQGYLNTREPAYDFDTPSCTVYSGEEVVKGYLSIEGRRSDWSAIRSPDSGKWSLSLDIGMRQLFNKYDDDDEMVKSYFKLEQEIAERMPASSGTSFTVYV